MQENTLGIKFMVLVSITSPTAISTKDLGTKEENKAMECTVFEMARPKAENGTTAVSRFLSLLLQMQFFEQFR